MPTALICCSDAATVEADLGRSLLWRREFARRFATSLPAAQSLALERPDIVLVDADLHWAASFVSWSRGHPSARVLPVAVLARGEAGLSDLELLQRGANALLRLPAGPEWDRRLARLMHVPVRKALRMDVTFKVEVSGWMGTETHLATGVNLSETGMLVESSWLQVGQDVHFAFELPGQPGLVSGRACVVRQAAPGRFGLEFAELSGECLVHIRGVLASL